MNLVASLLFSSMNLSGVIPTFAAILEVWMVREEAAALAASEPQKMLGRPGLYWVLITAL